MNIYTVHFRDGRPPVEVWANDVRGDVGSDLHFYRNPFDCLVRYKAEEIRGVLFERAVLTRDEYEGRLQRLTSDLNYYRKEIPECEAKIAELRRLEATVVDMPTGEP